MTTMLATMVVKTACRSGCKEWVRYRTFMVFVSVMFCHSSKETIYACTYEEDAEPVFLKSELELHLFKHDFGIGVSF